MKWQTKITIILLLFLSISLVPLAKADVNYNANTYIFTWPSYGTAMAFNTNMVFSRAYRSSNYWYFNTSTVTENYGFRLTQSFGSGATLLVTDFFATSGSVLKFSVTAGAGITTTTKVYIPSKGSPTSVTGATGWSYDVGSKILTVTILHASTVSIVVTWIADTTDPTYSSIDYNTTTINSPCLFSVKWQDNVGLSKYYFSTNNSGVWVNNTIASFSGNPSWANVTKTLSNTVGLVIAFKWYANDTSNNWAVTTTGTLTLTTTGSAFPTSSAVAYNTTEQNHPCLFEVTWSDDVALSGTIFSWNGTGSWTNSTFIVLAGVTDSASILKTLPNTVGSLVRFLWYANDSDNQWSATSIYSFTVTATPTPPPVVPTYTWSGNSLLQFFAEGDLLGFLQGIYVTAFGSADIFFALVAMVGFGAIYIRTRSLILVSILWLLVGVAFIAALPLVAGLGVLLVILGIAGLLYQLFRPSSVSY